MEITAKEMAENILRGKNIVFLTGAGVSTPSGIPDYRSMEGIYTTSGLKEPEYLLSREAMLNDTEDFYKFISQLYQKNACPNLIHQKMAEMSQTKNVTIITQNIDGLHQEAGGANLIEFHGTLASCFCEGCKTTVASEAFINSYRHESCGGTIRPKVVLYDEQIDYFNIVRSQKALMKADTIVIVGTSFKVYPFASLIYEANPDAAIYAVNKEPLSISGIWEQYVGDAVDVFRLV